MNSKLPRTFMLMAPLLIALGCGDLSNPLPKPIEVKGRIKLPNGSGLTRGSVAFFPVEEAKGSETFGTLAPDGTYATRVIPGKYRIAIEPEWVRAATRPGSTSIPKRFWNPNSSGLVIEIAASNADDVSFSLN